MKIKSITTNNFRLLEETKINLEDDFTLIVGKNNTGKTSLFEAVRIATDTNGKFIFEDFSAASYIVFEECYKSYQAYLTSNESEKEKIETQIRKKIPKIKVSFEIEYNIENDSLNELSEFITDLENEQHDATICISYEPENTLTIFKRFDDREDREIKLIPYLKDYIKHLYKIKCYAIDRTNSINSREIENSFRNKIKKVVSFETINAMRILDDTNYDSKKTLAQGFSNYYKQRNKSSNDVINLERALKSISEELKGKYKKVLEDITGKLSNFGAKTPVKIPDIEIDSQFESEKVINNNICYLYKQEGINLPESYNGLGYSNLIYMILELASFIEKFKNYNQEEMTSNFLVVLIEEPEAHMHPQMQQVFIHQILELIKENSDIKVQLIITTHSSHILAEAGIDNEKGFKRIRYFNRIAEKKSSKARVEVKDFNLLDIKEKYLKFLKQYLTLQKSDIFFADKIIMIEGTTERLLMPLMIKKVAPSLCNEYITLLEVGGAYAHIFKEIINFIGVKTLIITDIDSAKEVPSKKNQEKKVKEKCPVEQGEITTNQTLIKWLPRKEKIEELTQCKKEEKTESNTRVAYQIKENEFNARSFEDAFINANKDLLSREKKAYKEFTFLRGKTLEEACQNPPSDSKVKINFTFDIMTFDEKIFEKWNVPLYIKEGLEWLANND